MYVPSTPSKKPRGSPLKKSTTFSPTSDEEVADSEDEEATTPSIVITNPDRIFYCRLAVDSRRGLFYRFDWDRHQHDALLRTRPPTSEAGPSSRQDVAHVWGEGATWDVVDEKHAKVKQRARPIEPESGEEEQDDDDAGSDVYDGVDAPSEEDEGMDADEDEEEQDGVEQDEDDDNSGEPRTPSKKRKGRIQATSTPRKNKRSKTIVQPTPHSKAAIAKRKRAANATTATPRKRKATFAIRFPEQSLTFQASMAHLPKDPWLRSMHALHVGSRPDSLPCREAEYTKVLQCVGELLEEGSGGCICKLICLLYKNTFSLTQTFCSDISGVPGTGKTATVHSVVKELKRMAQSSVCALPPFFQIETTCFCS